MIQVLLVLFGLYCLITGKLKISSKKEIERPISTYFGLMFIAYAIGINYLPTGIIYEISFYGSLVLFSILLISQGNKVKITEEEGSKMRRNTGILIGFVVLLIAIFVYVLML